MPRLLRRCLAVCLLLFAAAAPAQDGLYAGEVQVNGQGAAEREAALPRALAQVLVKLTGDVQAPRRSEVAELLRDAGRMLQGYSYRQEQELAGGVPVYRQILIARFDRSAVDALIAAAGLPVWPEPRPPVALWLAIDDGRGARLVGAQQVNVVKPLTQRGVERGVEFTVPQGGPVDEAGVDAVWRLDGAALAPLSARYGSDRQLLGKLYRGDAGWISDWALLDGGAELARWSNTDADARRALASGAEGAAEALARKYAKVMPSGLPGVFEVEVLGVRGTDDYLRLSGYLQTLAIVRAVVPVEATPERLRLRLELATGLEGFAALVETGTTLARIEGDGSEPVFSLR